MPDKRCENGHFIDELWDICPYCPPPRPAEASSAPAGSVHSDRGARQSVVAPVEPTRKREGPIPSDPIQRTVVAPKPMPEPEVERLVVGWLVSLTGKTRGESFPVRMGRNTIGRSSRSDIVVNDDQVSSHHADVVFRPDERRFIIMDHNSTNGTFVNGAEIPARKDLLSRDIVRVGKQKFIFQALCDQTFGWDDQEYSK